METHDGLVTSSRPGCCGEVKSTAVVHVQLDYKCPFPIFSEAYSSFVIAADEPYSPHPKNPASHPAGSIKSAAAVINALSAIAKSIGPINAPIGLLIVPARERLGGKQGASKPFKFSSSASKEGTLSIPPRQPFRSNTRPLRWI